ncbi:nodulation S family protein [Bacillus sp. NP157]|nr:nodulation S family protein [Bacillus sp. NP157]
MAALTFDEAHFDALYRRDPDPWKFRGSSYEHEKYAATVAALPGARYRHVLELGSSIGELTARLAERAERVTGIETSSVAIAAARHRCSALPGVSFIHAHLPAGDWALESDAVVLSEVLYYLAEAGVKSVAERLRRCAPLSDLVLVHWTGTTDYPLAGDHASDLFIEEYGADGWRHTRTPDYRLDVLSRQQNSR